MKRLLLALAMLAVSAAAAAQEQRGSIEGIVRDSSGGVLPGATIEARSPSMAGLQTTVTDTGGLYRFPALPPGRYEVSATLQGFQPAKSADVRLELGQVLKVDLAMAVGGVSENVKVVAESPLIDVKQNTAGANVQAEIIERIPKGRDFAAVVTSAPGITSEARNRGIQIDGASGADNRFLIDGVDTTNLLNGTSGKTLPVDFVDTVQAKASGYAAEYRHRSAA
ncbi:MAG TPA: carboxypeptidase-like regulatory domain-containing protein [Vicinamibacterales bacterium]|nr:carboxypeptidase-like regulatory domain-containing protein [Vicinamibacterales bacterium]